ncbi:DHH family phosphoesterase [Paenibacillus koleovorans]|uniref:DHH family phosphoesterase n=1 Tax=Paenibacillus koleovorans TaxID=121608 RepID=UPI000FD84BB8|nr:bifunctional oligoribonuclease/PAP phosphatase NrnA [Paenibacillus koleovorans]
MNERAEAETYEQQLVSAERFIRANDDFLVVAHVNPDGDAASSTFAVGWLLDRLGKRYTLANDDAIPSKFAYLWGYSQLLTLDRLPEGATYRAVISVDCADESRIGQIRERIAPDAELLNIDHHPTNDYFGKHQLIRADAAATVELLYELAEQLQVPVTRELADCIYTGLLTDTGGFRYSNTSPHVMQIASDLLQHGVEGYKLAENLLEKITKSHIAVLQRALGTLSFAYDHKICWISVSAEDMAVTNATPEDLDGLIQYPRNIEGVEVGLLFKQADERKVKVSFRSAGSVDVAQVAKTFGGGGHVRASGCTLEGELQEVIARVVEEVGRSIG